MTATPETPPAAWQDARLDALLNTATRPSWSAVRSGPTLEGMQRLSSDDVAAIVQRAVEVQGGADPGDGPASGGHPPAHSGKAPGGGGIDLTTTQSVLRELGISDDATGQAIAEWRSGALADRERPPAPTGWTPVATVSRVLTHDAGTVRARFESELRRQCFAPGRDPEGNQIWIARRGLVPQLRRSLDVNGTLALKAIPRLRADIRPALGGAGARVTLAVDMQQTRKALIGMLVGIPAAVTLVAVADGVHPVVDAIGAALTAGGVLGARSGLTQQRRTIEESLHLVLEDVTRQ